jgi:hypothetical protein
MSVVGQFRREFLFKKWGQCTELFDEIRNILEKEQKTNAAELSENLKDQIKTLLQSITL